MMDVIFLKIVNMSVTASWLILAVIVLRLALRKAPRSLVCLLWLLVAIRLICPFSIESAFSLIPSGETIPPAILYEQPPQSQAPVVLDVAINPVLPAPFTPTIEASQDRVQTLSVLGSLLWLVGMAAMLAYALASFLRLRRRVETAVRLHDNIWQSEAATSPFVLGLLRPRIYLPFSLSQEETTHIIAHEQAHIARRDHWWKPLGFVLLAVYWFNPLIWLAYVLLCRDLELACDEKVVGHLTREQRADYSAALLRCSVPRKLISACPLAFGEVGVKERVNKVINYKKPAFWLVIVAIAALVIAGACLLTDPPRDEENMINLPRSWPDTPQLAAGQVYETSLCVFMNPLSSFLAADGDNGFRYELGEDSLNMVKKFDDSLYRTITGLEWGWQDFPWTREEWAQICFDENIREYLLHIPEEQYLYQPLDDKHFLLAPYGDLWLVELKENPQMGTYLWSIFALTAQDKDTAGELALK